MNSKIRHLIERLMAVQILMGPIVSTAFPTNPWRVPFLNTPPKGLHLLHAADSPPEADMLRQILIQAGFHPEYVPPTSTGVFGPVGSIDIFIPNSESVEASRFLAEYYSAVLEH